MIGIEEAVDHGQPVTLTVRQASAHQSAGYAVFGWFAIFDDIAVHRGLFDHVGEIHLIHLGHAAAGVAGLQITLEEFELLFRSEEHTSELQSLMRISYAVFCLKKQKTKRQK